MRAAGFATVDALDPSPGMLEQAGLHGGAARRVGRWLVAGVVLTAAVVTVFALRLPEVAWRGDYDHLARRGEWTL